MQVVSPSLLAIQTQQDRRVLRTLFTDCVHNSMESLDDSIQLPAHSDVTEVLNVPCNPQAKSGSLRATV